MTKGKSQIRCVKAARTLGVQCQAFREPHSPPRRKLELLVCWAVLLAVEPFDAASCQFNHVNIPSDPLLEGIIGNRQVNEFNRPLCIRIFDRLSQGNTIPNSEVIGGEVLRRVFKFQERGGNSKSLELHFGLGDRKVNFLHGETRSICPDEVCRARKLGKLVITTCHYKEANKPAIRILSSKNPVDKHRAVSFYRVDDDFRVVRNLFFQIAIYATRPVRRHKFHASRLPDFFVCESLAGLSYALPGMKHGSPGTKSLNANTSEQQFFAQCNDLTLVILHPAVQVGNSAVSRHDHLILGIANNQRRTNIHLGPCRQRCDSTNEYEGKTPELFEVELADTGMSSVSFSDDRRTLTVINYRVYVSWDGNHWFSLLGLDPSGEHFAN